MVLRFVFPNASPRNSALGHCAKDNLEQSITFDVIFFPKPALQLPVISNLKGRVKPSTKLMSTQSSPFWPKEASNLVSTGGAQPASASHTSSGPPLSPISQYFPCSLHRIF